MRTLSGARSAEREFDEAKFRESETFIKEEARMADFIAELHFSGLKNVDLSPPLQNSFKFSFKAADCIR